MSHGYNRHREQLGRFMGNGNCWVGKPGNGLRGWQVTCCRCGKLSKSIPRHKGDSLNPEGITRKFANQGWKIGTQANADICEQCGGDRQRLSNERERERNKGKIEHLHQAIVSLDRMLTDSVGLLQSDECRDEQLQLINEFGSLLATAFCLDLLPAQWKEVEPKPVEPELSIVQRFEAASDQQRAEFWKWLRDRFAEAKALHEQAMCDSEQLKQARLSGYAQGRADAMKAIRQASPLQMTPSIRELASNGKPQPPAPKPPERPMPPPKPPAPEPPPAAATASKSAMDHLSRMRAQLNSSGSTTKH